MGRNFIFAARDTAGQMYVELACVLPVVIIAALIVYNAGCFANYCAVFDQAAQDSIVAQGVSPAGEQSAADSTRVIRDALADALGDAVEIEVAREQLSRFGTEGETFSLLPQLTRYVCTLRYRPWPSALSIAGVSLGAPLVLEHSTSLVVDPYKPGVVV